MPTTTNFGWTTPADTDLVKDGAAAIRTLAGNIDTSLVDLKGGTTGQVLAKNSATDLDYIWVAQDDSNAIQNAIVDAKGDLIVGTAADTPARLAVGATNGHVLTVDSAEASGLKYAAPDPLTTKGDLFTYSTTEARLAVGTNGQTLVANSSTATGLEWQTVTSGGMTLINSGGTTLSGAAVTISSIPSTYKNLQLVIQNFTPAADNVAIWIRVNADSTVNRHSQGIDVYSTGQSFDQTRWTILGQDNATSQSFILLNIWDYANTSTWKTADCTAFTNNSTTSTNFDCRTGVFAYNQTGAISSLEIRQAGANFTSGTAYLYGVK
jgi:hypothetical protein